MPKIRTFAVLTALFLMAGAPALAQTETYGGYADPDPQPRVAAEEVEPAVPVTVWELTQGSLDGIGSWIATVNVPTAQPGQVPPYYAYVHEFYFENSEDAFGMLALTTQPEGKRAEFVVDWGDGRIVGARVPFEWTAGRLYLPVVYKVGDGLWAAWVYDHAVSTWNFIAPLYLPPGWGKIAPLSATYLEWFGGPAPTCSAIPKGDVYRMAPFGFVGSTTTAFASLIAHDEVPGTCPASATTEFGGQWARYQVGSDTAQ
jgi:hypothetical protein